jgi:hypothetical protein
MEILNVVTFCALLLHCDLELYFCLLFKQKKREWKIYLLQANDVSLYAENCDYTKLKLFLCSCLHAEISIYQRWLPELKDQGCDNVLPVQGYKTPQGTMANKYGAIMERLARENPRKSEKSPLQYHLVYHESHMKSPETTSAEGISSPSTWTKAHNTSTVGPPYPLSQYPRFAATRKKIVKLKKYAIHTFQTARQARTGRNMVKSSNPNFLITGYVQVRTYDFHCKMCNNNTFFHCACVITLYIAFGIIRGFT